MIVETGGNHKEGNGERASPAGERNQTGANAVAERAAQLARNGPSCRGEAPSRIQGKKKAPRTNPRRHGCERGVLALLPSPAPDNGVLNVDVGLRRAENLGQIDRIHGSGVRTTELKQLEGLLEDRQ